MRANARRRDACYCFGIQIGWTERPAGEVVNRAEVERQTVG
jgi:hypothetical protein